MKNKKVLYGIIAGVLLVGGVGVTATLNRSNKKTVATSKTVTSNVVTTTQSTTGNGVVSELESRLNTEVTAETNVAELEQQLTTVTDDKTREALSKKLVEVKQQHAVKVEEKAKVEHAQPTPQPSTVVKADEVSQPVQPAPSTPQPQVTPAPQPVETTTTRQTTQQTQGIPVVEPPKRTSNSSKTIIIGGMGNSGREFSTMEEAEDWADNHPNYKNGEYGYMILPIVYSDYSQTYTVEWGR